MEGRAPPHEQAFEFYDPEIEWDASANGGGLARDVAASTTGTRV